MTVKIKLLKPQGENKVEVKEFLPSPTCDNCGNDLVLGPDEVTYLVKRFRSKMRKKLPELDTENNDLEATYNATIVSCAGCGEDLDVEGVDL